MSLIKASIWLTVAELVFNLSGYVVHAVLGRSLGPADYGRYSLVIALSTMVVVLIGRGVPVAMSKYLSEVRKEDPSKILSIRKTGAILQTILIAVLTIIYFLSAPLLASALNDPSLTKLFRLSSFIIPAFALASFYVYYFNGIHKFNSQSIIKFYRGIAKVVVIIALGLFWSVPGAVLGHAIVPFSVFLLAVYLDPYKKQKSSPKTQVSWKKLLNFAWPITTFMIFYEIMISIDLFLVKGILQSDAITGFYNAALTVGRIPFYAFYFLTIILLPKISESTAQNDKARTDSMMKNSMRFLFLLLFPSVALLSAFSDSAIRFFYGQKYTPGAEALTILSFGLGFLTIFYILAFVLNGAGKNKAPMTLSILGAIMNTALGFILIKQMGISGAAIAFTFTSLVLTIFIVWYTNIKISSFLSWKSLFSYLAGSAGIFFLAVNFFSQGRFIFILWSILLMIVYGAFLLALGEIKKEDLLELKRSLARK